MKNSGFETVCLSCGSTNVSICTNVCDEIIIECEDCGQIEE
jgi:hypothetical protein